MLALCLLFALTACQKPAEQNVLPAETEAAESGNTDQPYDFPDIRFFDASLMDGTAETAEELFDEKDVTVINVWATWCGPCLNEMEDLAEFEKTLPDNVQLITFCVDGVQHTEDCEAILAEAGFEGKSVIDANGDFHTLLEQMQYVPTTLFVDKSGKQLCDSLIGSPADLAASYREKINAALKAQGKSAMQ